MRSRRPASTRRYTPPCSVARVAEYSCWNAASTRDPLTCTRVTRVTRAALRHVTRDRDTHRREQREHGVDAADLVLGHGAADHGPGHV